MVERYSFDLGLEGEGVWPCKFGAWVGWNDYASLLAENERLKAERVDLEQFRGAVGSRKYGAECDMRRGYDVVGFEFLDRAKAASLECSRLLALIDAHKGE